jgi:hypothetical protein
MFGTLVVPMADQMPKRGFQPHWHLLLKFSRDDRNARQREEKRCALPQLG